MAACIQNSEQAGDRHAMPFSASSRPVSFNLAQSSTTPTLPAVTQSLQSLEFLKLLDFEPYSGCTLNSTFSPLPYFSNFVLTAPPPSTSSREVSPPAGGPYQKRLLAKHQLRSLTAWCNPYTRSQASFPCTGHIGSTP